MRLQYTFLVAALGLLACSEVASAITDTNMAGIASTQNDKPRDRFLRTDKMAETATDEKNEERATMYLGEVFKDKAATNNLLSSWLHEGKTVQDVATKLKLLNVPVDVAKFTINWAAMLKFQRMHYTKATGRTLPYAYFGTGAQTEAKTKEQLTKWAVAGDSVESVAKTFGVWGLSKGDLILHRNYKAFKTFVKYKRQWKEIQDSFNNVKVA